MKPLRNVKLTLEYDGTRFFGFQRQPGKRTVQSELEKAFKRLFRKKIKISSASGRTDRGVHARGQVINFKINSKIPLFKIQQALNTYLPEDLVVVKVNEMSLSFNARFWAKTKTYQYTVLNSKTRSPLYRKSSYYFPYSLNVSLIKKAGKMIIGRHNFKSFQSKADSRNSVRTLHRLTIEKRGDLLVFIAEGDGFLYNMVRNIVGTLLLVGTKKISLADFKEILDKCNRSHLGPTAPPQGLCLLRVKY